MAKVALLIGVSEYEPGLTPLPSAAKDVEALQRVLQDPELGGFDTVKTLINPDPVAMQSEIEALVTEQRSLDDLVLLYFSGHGVRDGSRNLYFATRITRNNANGDLIRATAVSARSIDEILHNSRIRRQVIILDCCYSGAFDPALRLKDDNSVDLHGQLGAKGRVVLASSDSTQYSQVQAGADLSLYTHYLVEGIETGAGDLNEDGQISAQELHHYAFDRVREAAPNMTPKLITLKDLGFEIVLSKAKVTDPRLRYRKTVARYADGETLRPSGRAVLDTLRQQLNLTVVEAEEIEAEVFQPYRERLANIQNYLTTLRLEAEHQYPLDETARDAMESLRQLLGLRSEDVVLVEREIQTEFVPLSDQTAPELLQRKTPQSAETDFTEKHTSLNAEEYFDRGLAKQKEGDMQGAIADFDEAICLAPDNADVYFLRGSVKYALGDNREAIIDFDETVRRNPNESSAYFVRGIVKSELGEYEEAITDFSEALRLKPNDAEVYFKRGNVKGHLNNFKEAIKDFNEALCLKPDYADVYYVRGNAKSRLGDREGSIQDYDEAIRLKSQYADDAYYARGSAKASFGDKKGAIADLDEALFLTPDFVDVYLSRGLYKIALGDKKGALSDYDKAIFLKSDYAGAYSLRGRVKFDLGNKIGGLLDLDEAIRLESDFATAHYNRGFIKSNLGDHQGSIIDYQNAALLYQKQGDMESYRNALKMVEQLKKKGKGFLGGLFS
jgi:tetratricopeptide (TPR) repeat protein